MHLLILSKQILREMLARKLRSALAVFGIATGTLTVILLLALGTGFHDATMQTLMDSADGSFYLWPGKTTQSYQGYTKGQPVYITTDAIVKLPQTLPSVEIASPWFIRPAGNMSYNGKRLQKMVHGVGPEFVKIRKIQLEAKGRFFNQFDIDGGARVIVLGNKVKELFFGADDNALGKQILLENVPFTVIGVMPQSIKLRRTFYDNAVMIPYTCYYTLYGDNRVMYTMILPYPDVNPAQFEQTLRSYFAEQYHFNKNDLEALHIFNTSKIYQFLRWFFVGLQMFLGFCGSLTLVIGSIGVANIMFLIVTERTREIGLRKAMGATDFDILLQVLLEALIIVAIGGLLGFVIAAGVIVVMHFARIPDWMGVPTISIASALTTIIILGLVGFVAGYFPARRAAKMDPVDALNL